MYKFIDFIVEWVKSIILKTELSVIIYYFPFLGNWILKGALKIILKKANNLTINPLLNELNYQASVKEGEIIFKKVQNAQDPNDWNNATNGV